MKHFEIIEHTADIGLRAYGKDLKELFNNAAIGMFHIMGLDRTIRDKERVRIKVKSNSYEELLINWLSELLYQFNKTKVFFKKFLIKEFGNFYIYADAVGQKIDFQRFKFGDEIKAVTYHDLRIEKKNSGWRCNLIFDV